MRRNAQAAKAGAGFVVRGKKGRAVLWWNRKPDGAPCAMTPRTPPIQKASSRGADRTLRSLPPHPLILPLSPGELDLASRHAGCPLRSGQKYVITKWLQKGPTGVRGKGAYSVSE